MTPDLSTSRQGILDTIKSNPSLAYSPELIKAYQNMEGTLVNGAIPTSFAPTGQPSQTYTPTVISSQTGVQKINETNQQLQQKAEAFSKPVEPVTAPVKTTSTEDVLANETKTPQQLANDKSLSDAKDQHDSQMLSWKNFEQTMLQSVDAATAGTIQALSAQFEQRRAELLDLNKRSLAVVNTAQTRSGGTKYTTEVSQGIIGAEEAAGIQRLNSLEQSYRAAVAEAMALGAEKKYTMQAKVFEKVQELETEKRKEINALMEKVAERDKKIQEERKTLEDEQSIYDTIKSGKASAAEIYGALGGKVTSKTIKDFLDNITPKESKDKTKNAFDFTNEDAGFFMSKGMSGEDIQTLQDKLNKHGLYGKIPEAGNKALSEILTPAELQAVKQRLFTPKKTKAEAGLEGNFTDTANGIRIARLMFGGGKALSDQDRDMGFQLYQKGKEEGLDVNEIVNKGFGYEIQNVKDQPLANALRDTVLNFDGEKGMADYDWAGIALLINAGKETAAVNKVENQGYSYLLQKGLVKKENFVSEADVKFIADKTKQIEDLLGKGWSNEIGAFTGNIQSYLSRKFGYGQATQIMAKLQSITSDLINKRAGSALTDTEWDRLVAPSVPSKSESAKAWKDKLDELKNAPLERLNANRQMVSLPSLSIDNVLNPDTKVNLYVRGYKTDADELLNSFDSLDDKSFWSLKATTTPKK